MQSANGWDVVKYLIEAFMKVRVNVLNIYIYLYGSNPLQL